jgi:hypothetical protein
MPVVTLDIGDGSGFPGTTNNAVTLNLDNPDDKVWGFQVDICDADNYLTCTGCETTDRTNLHNCASAESPNGCCRITVYSFKPNTFIQEGDGPIAILKYTVLAEAPERKCRDLNPEGTVVAGENGLLLGMELLPGQFCFASESEAIPTTSEWGMIIFMTIILGLGVITLLRRRMV